MDLDRLQEFASVAQNRSIAKAAKQLGLSNATLSARLQRFQQQLGTTLLIHTPEGMALTPSGQQFLPSALELLNSYRQLRRQIDSAKTHYYHRLRIAITGSSLPLHLGPFLDKLNLTYPNIDLELLDDSRYGVIDGLTSGEVDIYFAPIMQSFDPQGLAVKSVTAPSPYVVLPRSHPLAERAMLSLRELEGNQFIAYPFTAESAIRDFQLQNLQDSGMRYSLYETQTSTLFYKLLIPVGKGVVLRPTPIMDLPPNTVSIPVTDLPHPATMCFFYDKMTQNEEAQAFARDFPAFVKETMSHEHHAPQ